MKNIYLSLIILLLYCFSSANAQDNLRHLIIKGGTTDYASVQGLSVGGGSGPGEWNIGPIIGIGMERELRKNLFYQIIAEFSYNRYGEEIHYSERIERGYNTVYELTAIIKKKWGWYYLVGGIGYALQKSSDSYKSGYFSNGEYFRYMCNKGMSTNGVTGLIGHGIEISVYQNTEIFIEGSLRLRHYVSPVVQLGVKRNI